MEKLSYTRNGVEYAIPVVGDDVADAIGLVAESFGVPATAVEYLLQYGFKQSLQDAAAQPASEAKAEAESKDGATPESISKAVADAIDGAMGKRLDAIKSGSVAMRGGGGRVTDPFESMVRTVIDEIIAAASKAKGKKFPKGDKLVALRAEVRAKAKDKVESEAKTRLEAKSPVDVEIDV